MNDKTKAVLHISAPDNQEFSEKGVIVNQSNALNGVCVEIYLPTKPIELVSTLQDLIDQAEADKKAYPLTWTYGWEMTTLYDTSRRWIRVGEVKEDGRQYRRKPHADIIMQVEQDKIDYPEFWWELVQYKSIFGGGFQAFSDKSFYKKLEEHSGYIVRQHPHRESIIEWHKCSEADKKRWEEKQDSVKLSWGNSPNPKWLEYREYRLRTRTCKVTLQDGTVLEYPEPVRGDLEVGRVYFSVCIRVARHIYQPNNARYLIDLRDEGALHPTEENALHHLAALQAVNSQVSV